MKVSVIIPCYNVDKYVDECLKSVIAQSHTDIEILCVDDCSTDDTAKKLAEWTQRDSRIKVITHTENKGVSRARNSALDIATGEWVACVDGDDFVSPFYIEKLLRWATDNGCDIAVCGYSLAQENQTVETTPMTMELNYPEIIDKHDYFSRIYSEREVIYVVPWGKIYNKKLFDNLRYEQMINEDEDIIIKIVDKANKVVVCYDNLYHYVIRPGSIMRTRFSEKKLDVLNVYNDRIEYFNSKGMYDLTWLTYKAYMVKCLELYEMIDDSVENGKDYKKHLMSVLSVAIDGAQKCPIKSKKLILEMKMYSIFPKKYKKSDRGRLLFGLKA